MFLGAGIFVWLVRAIPKRATLAVVLPFGVSLPVVTNVCWQIAWFFTKAGAFVFASGLGYVTFLYGGVVKEYGWLNDNQFLDAVAVAMITPGPVVITVGFIGFLVAGFWGAAVAALATFLPCYSFVVIAAPYFKRLASGLALSRSSTALPQQQ